MGKKLIDNTLVVHPDTAVPTSLYAGDEVPDWAEDLVGDHLVEGGTVATGGRPPESGRGSGEKAWRDYAASKDIAIEDDADKAGVIAAVKAHEDGAGDGGEN